MAKDARRNPLAGLSFEEVESLLEDTLGKMPPGYRLPFMQWFEDDFRGSEGVEEMEPLERLMYRQLLAKAWASKDAPYLPLDDQKIYRLSDCPSTELWEKHKDVVLDMFRVSTATGKRYHARQMLDYVGQMHKVVINAGNGALGGRPKKPKANPTETERLSTETERLFFANPDVTHKEPEPEPNEEPELELELEETETPFPENGQGGQEEQMKIKQEITPLCFEFFGYGPETYANVWQEMVGLERATSRGAVVNEFRDWAAGNTSDDVRGKPVSAYLAWRRSNATRVASGASDPEVRDLVRELTFLSGGLVTFDDRAKALLAKAIVDGNHITDIIKVFKADFYPNLDTSDTKKLKYAGGNFAQVADSLVYAMCRKAKERAQEAAAVAEAKERLETQAAAERVARRASLEREADSVEETLGGGE